MHLNPYGECAVLMAALLADDWPVHRVGIEARTREFGMTMDFGESPDDHRRTRQVIDEWLRVVDASEPVERARLLNGLMAQADRVSEADRSRAGGMAHPLPRRRQRFASDVLGAVISVVTALHLI